MNLIKIRCAFCGKEFLKAQKRVNEAKKFGWKQYCSKECQRQAKIKRIEITCANPDCDKKVVRELSQFGKSKSGRFFCSRSCAASFNNSKFPKRKVKTRTRKCTYCGKKFESRGEKYCSRECKDKAQIITGEEIINDIKFFYKKHGRIPFKKESHHYKAARLRFGTWNKAIKEAGFSPNLEKFAKKHKAKDGHICDSLSEKIIDDWLYKNDLEHKIHVPYPGDSKFTCDFVINKYFIEFFGLDGELPRYTELAKEKRQLAKKQNLNLVELKPEHIFPENRLNIRLNFLLKTENQVESRCPN